MVIDPFLKFSCGKYVSIEIFSFEFSKDIPIISVYLWSLGNFISSKDEVGEGILQ